MGSRGGHCVWEGPPDPCTRTSCHGVRLHDLLTLSLRAGRDERSRWFGSEHSPATSWTNGVGGSLEKPPHRLRRYHRVPAATAATADRLRGDTGNVSVSSAMLGSTVVKRSCVTLRGLLDGSQSFYYVKVDSNPVAPRQPWKSRQPLPKRVM